MPGERLSMQKIRELLRLRWEQHLPQVLSAFAPSGGWGTLPAHCGDWNGMRCSVCGSAAISERPERTTQGYRRYRYGTCGKQFNERSVGVLNRAQ